jgi:deoxyribodipyrimidine photo-lyase
VQHRNLSHHGKAAALRGIRSDRRRRGVLEPPLRTLATARGERLKTALRNRGIEARSFNSALIREPRTVTTQKGEPYRVLTPFWKALRATGVSEPAAAAPKQIPGPATAPESEPLSSWALRPTAPDWAGGMQAMWAPGEAGAQARLDDFAAGAGSDYRDTRNMPGVAGTSRLSPHLHFGEIDPRQIWRSITAQALARTGNPMPSGVETYLSEIAWREFSYHLLFHFMSEASCTASQSLPSRQGGRPRRDTSDPAAG